MQVKFGHVWIGIIPMQVKFGQVWIGIIPIQTWPNLTYEAFGEYACILTECLAYKQEHSVNMHAYWPNGLAFGQKIFFLANGLGYSVNLQWKAFGE